MRSSLLLVLGLLVTPGLSDTALVWAQDAAAGTPLERAAIEFVGQMGRRDFTAAVSRFDPTMSAFMPAAELEKTWDTVEVQFGSFQGWSQTTTGEIQGYDYVLVTSTFENAVLDIRVVFDDDSRIAGLLFQPHVDPDALELLYRYDWPGNVRELENVCERACVLVEGDSINGETIRPWLRGREAADEPFARLRPGHLVEDMERQLVERTLRQFGGHRARTAKTLGIGLRTLGMKLKKWRGEDVAPRGQPGTLVTGRAGS